MKLARSWWAYAKYGNEGKELDLDLITCPFCCRKGNFSFAHRAEMRQPKAGAGATFDTDPRTSKVLHFDTLTCAACAGHVMVCWPCGPGGYFSREQVPLPSGCHPTVDDLRERSRKRANPSGKTPSEKQWPLYWDGSNPGRAPTKVARLLRQTRRSRARENWGAAATMGRRTIRAALRDCGARGARGSSFRDELDDLTERRILPSYLREWAHELPEPRNRTTPAQAARNETRPHEVLELMEFLDVLLDFLYEIPAEIHDVRRRARSDAQG